jgi:UDP-N-acetylmuramyl-tripeptide synthetase
VRLSRLIAALEPISVNGLAGGDPEIASLHYRSQEVAPGGLFVAIAGLSTDGHDYVADAVARGAAAVVTEKPVPGAAALVRVADSRRALAELSVRFYGNPSSEMVVIAVTGTNGKTTTSYLIESILAQAGHRPGVIGTINYRYGGESFANPVTTPESLDLQRILADMRGAGVTHVVLEASSHAIELKRIHGCLIDVAVFTNLSQDHLDFHGDMEAYWAAKKRLFTHHLVTGEKAGRAKAVVNTDSAHGAELAAALRLPVLTAGTGPGCALRGEGLACTLKGVRGTIAAGDELFDFDSPLTGRHNAENILCAAGAAWALGVPPAAIRAGIEALAHVPGRLERVADPGGRFVYVDYAHTPDALENVLAALRALTAERIVCVFGCGGDRDRGKRPQMGAIAARLSDLAVVTSDNPRSEPPQAIIDQILPGVLEAGAHKCPAAGEGVPTDRRSFVVEPDRRRAIGIAIHSARPGDTVLIAGKGHETYQIVGRTVLAFDDREEARRAIEKLERS